MKIQKILSLVVTLCLSLVFVAGVGFGLLSPIQRADAAPPAGFVYRCGTHFCLNGEPFYFAGANTYDVFTFGDGSSIATQSDIENRFMDKARIDAHFARLQADEVTVLRLWMFSHESWHGFEPSKGVYSEAQFMLFDYIIVSAQMHNVRLIPVFENYWEAYGGIDTRLSWEGLTGGHPGRAKFFNKSVCPGCFTQYKNYVNYVLNRINHYTGVKYKDDTTIMAWELMNEPRYQDVSAEENTSGATLRAWVDEMGAYIKAIDPNHMLGTGLEGHESRYGFGGNEGNPFIGIHQSPYVDFTSAHPYVDESWANLTMDQSRVLVRAWINDSHNVVGKPFFMGEFNTHTGDRSAWWTMFYQELEAGDAGGSAFWWYQDHGVDSKFGVSQGAPELAVFRAHSAVMQAKSPEQPTATPSPPPDPTKILKVQYLARNTLPGDNEISPSVMIVNTGVGLQTVPLAELKLRYWYTSDGTQPQQYSCLWSELGCSAMTASIVRLATPREGADTYLELAFTGTGRLSPYASSGVIQNRINKTDWSNFNESNDWSFDGTKTAYADWNRITLYRNGALVWGIEPGGTPPPTTPPPTTPPPTTPPPTTPPPTTPPPTTPPPSGNTGWVSPSAQAAQSGGDGNGFQTSPTSAFADDSAFATDTDSGNGTSTSCTSTNKDRHAYYSYPISIPAGATINGIEVRLDSRADSTSGSPRHCVELSWNNGSSWTAARQTGTLTTSMVTRTLGSASDNWGRTWTTGELTSATLRVRITNVASSTSRDFFLDWVAVRVTYGGTVTPPPTTPPPTTPPPTTPPPTTPPPTTPPPTTPPPTTPPPGGACSPVTANISVPFVFDGPGTFCWRTSSLGSFINTWNVDSLTINGIEFANRWLPPPSYPPAINGFWYIGYRASVPWAHFEMK